MFRTKYELHSLSVHLSLSVRQASVRLSIFASSTGTNNNP